MSTPLFTLFVKENLKNRPEDFTITDDNIRELEAKAKKMREERDRLNPKFAGQGPDPTPRAEYNRLRQQLYNLQQAARSAETLCNNKADAVRGLEQRINDLFKLKKQAIADDHLGDERKWEHQIQILEIELTKAQEEFFKAKRYNTQAARDLRVFEFDNKQRIAELKAIVNGEGVPSPK